MPDNLWKKELLCCCPFRLKKKNTLAHQHAKGQTSVSITCYLTASCGSMKHDHSPAEQFIWHLIYCILLLSLSNARLLGVDAMIHHWCLGTWNCIANSAHDCGSHQSGESLAVQRGCKVAQCHYTCALISITNTRQQSLCGGLGGLLIKQLQKDSNG